MFSLFHALSKEEVNKIKIPVHVQIEKMKVETRDAFCVFGTILHVLNNIFI